jgi:5-methylcytosine-specific restriction protein B
MAKQFTWVPIYQELAKALLGYRNRQQELLALLREMGEAGLPMLSLTDRDAEGKEFPLAVMDPFTFFASFNRGIRQENRLAILAKLKKHFGLEAPVPTDLDAIPVVNNQQSWFFAFQASRAPQDIDIPWDLAKQAIEREPAQMDPRVFSQALGIKSVGAAKLTMGLFWFKPDQYFALDATNAAYCADNGRWLAGGWQSVGNCPSFCTLFQGVSGKWERRQNAGDSCVSGAITGTKREA